MRMPRARMLPLAMLAMAALLASKSVGLVRAAQTAQAAQAAPQSAASRPDHTAAMPVLATVPPPAAAPALPSAAELALLQDLRRRRADLDKQSAAIAQRESIAAAAEKRLQLRLDQLTALQDKLQSLESARRQRDEASWTGLVRIYEAMKPRDAALIFNDLDPAVLLQVVDRMNERKAAPVLAAMLPDRARELTADLAALRSRANQMPGTTGSGTP